MRIPTACPLILALTFTVFLSAAVVRGQTAPPVPPQESIESVVRSIFHHGMPYSLLRSYGPDAVPRLLELLDSEAEKPHWANIVWALGVIGDPRATAPLMGFLEARFSGEVDAATWQALVLVPQSLGMLAGHDEEAFRMLASRASPAAWKQRSMAWTYPTLGAGDRELLMTKLTVNGLGLCGTPKALKRLEELQVTLAADPEVWAMVRPNLEEAMVMAGKIQRYGHRAVFEGTTP